MDFKPKLWLHYVDDMIWLKHAPFLFSSSRPVTMEVEHNKSLPFLDALITRLLNGHFGHSVYRKPTHTNRYFHASSHHRQAQKYSVVSSIVHWYQLSLSDTSSFQKEFHHIHCTLLSHGFKSRDISNSILRHLSSSTRNNCDPSF